MISAHKHKHAHGIKSGTRKAKGNASWFSRTNSDTEASGSLQDHFASLASPHNGDRACVCCVRACACVYKRGAVFDANLHLRSPWIARGPLYTHARARKAGYILMHLPENTMVPINTAQSKQQAARIFIIQNHHRVACAWMRYVITCLSPYHFIPFLGIYAQAGRSIVPLITCGQRQHKAARDGDLGEDERERRWFVLERPRRDTNGGSEIEVTSKLQANAERTER